jgi:hypothetical protein
LKRKWFRRFGKRRLKKARLSKRLTAVFFEVSYYPKKKPRLSKKHSLKCQTMETTRFLKESKGKLAKPIFNALSSRHEYTVRTAQTPLG